MIHSNLNNKVILIIVVLCYVYVCFARSVSRFDVGNECTVSVNVTGTCKFLQNCSRAIEHKKQKIPILYCGDKNSQNPLVCCPNIGEISEQKCLEYGEEVYELSFSGPLLLERTQLRTSTCVNEGTTFVINGVDAQEKEFPHMALLGYGQEQNKSWLCGGALISDQYVLTAAHCSYARIVSSAAKWVRLGELNKAEEYDTHREDFNIKKFIKHPLYQPVIKYHDIALIQLDRQVTFSPYLRPACLNTAPALDINNKLIATGWGSLGEGKDVATILQKVALQQYTKTECQQAFSSPSYLRSLPNGIRDSVICAGDKKLAKDTCGGDSGGPLQIYHPKVYCMLSIAGVTAFGKFKCGEPGTPGVYTKVSDYIEWIENVVWT